MYLLPIMKLNFCVPGIGLAKTTLTHSCTVDSSSILLQAGSKKIVVIHFMSTFYKTDILACVVTLLQRNSDPCLRDWAWRKYGSIWKMQLKFKTDHYRGKQFTFGWHVTFLPDYFFPLDFMGSKTSLEEINTISRKKKVEADSGCYMMPNGLIMALWTHYVCRNNLSGHVDTILTTLSLIAHLFVNNCDVLFFAD